jgi:hypothetical protein
MSESSQFKFFGGFFFIMGISLALFAWLVGPGGTEFALASCLWSAVGWVAFKTGRFIERTQARIKVLEAKFPYTDTGEISFEPFTEN